MRLRPGLPTRTWDVLLATGVLALALGETLWAPGVAGDRAANAVFVTSMCLLLYVRRAHPLGTAAVLVVLAVPQAAFLADTSNLIATYLPLLIVAYGAGAYATGRDALVALGLLVTGASGVEAFDATDVLTALFPIALIVLCWVAGRTVHTRIRLAAELHEAAARVAEQRELDARLAVAEERRRIAREMHDVVAHSISLMVVQAGGARRILARDPERAEQAAARIRTAGTEALGEMQTLLGVLEAAPGPMPSLAALPALIERAREAGLPVALATVGRPRALAPGAELAAYRVVQEALTNAIKHAGGAPTGVQLVWGDHELELRVADRGDGTLTPRLAGGGHGLVGMGERLRANGGSLAAGPRPGGGFEVVARLPA